MIKIIGAGMAGLLAANMLRAYQPTIHEASEKLPNNHKALLRFRTSAVSDATGIPFRKVQVMKDIHMEGFDSTLAAVMAYSRKIGATSDRRSIISAIGLDIVERYIAPEDFISLMAKTANIIFNDRVFAEGEPILSKSDGPIISTIPLPDLAMRLKYEFYTTPFFSASKGWVISGLLPNIKDYYCSLYIPEPSEPFYRISITGNKLIIEGLGSWHSNLGDATKIAEQALIYLGMENVVSEGLRLDEQKFAKINPIDDNERKRFILWATENYGIYSLGRYATWRPGLLLDDVVNDVRVIQRLINGSSAYDHWKSSR